MASHTVDGSFGSKWYYKVNLLRAASTHDDFLSVEDEP